MNGTLVGLISNVEQNMSHSEIKSGSMADDSHTQWWQMPRVAVLASALIVGQMGLLGLLVKKMADATNVGHVSNAVTPASGASGAAQIITLKVVFKPVTTVEQISAAMAAVQGRIVGGPGALGLWEVEVPAAMQTTALRVLSVNNNVESVSQE